jgi:hypothetical protein
MSAIELSGQDTFSYLTGGTASSTQLVYLFLYAGGIPLGDLELMRRLFSAIAVGKTEGHPAAFGADILSLKPITSRRISGRGGTLKAIEKSREVTGPHAPDLSSQALVISMR